jgi:hypothetical protein
MSSRSALLPASLAALVIAAAPQARADTCYDFGNQIDGTQYAVNGGPIDIGIGRFQVRDLVLDGNVVAPNDRYFKVVGTQAIAGGARPEMYGKNVAIQMLPSEPVHQIRLYCQPRTMSRPRASPPATACLRTGHSRPG